MFKIIIEHNLCLMCAQQFIAYKIYAKMLLRMKEKKNKIGCKMLKKKYFSNKCLNLKGSKEVKLLF